MVDFWVVHSEFSNLTQCPPIFDFILKNYLIIVAQEYATKASPSFWKDSIKIKSKNFLPNKKLLIVKWRFSSSVCALSSHFIIILMFQSSICESPPTEDLNYVVFDVEYDDEDVINYNFWCDVWCHLQMCFVIFILLWNIPFLHNF